MAKLLEEQYGYCPICYAPCVSRKRKWRSVDDTCENGHEYAAGEALMITKEEASKNRVLRKLMENDGRILDVLIERLGEDTDDWVD